MEFELWTLSVGRDRWTICALLFGAMFSVFVSQSSDGNSENFSAFYAHLHTYTGKDPLLAGEIECRTEREGERERDRVRQRQSEREDVV